ncbi:MAG: iron-sulfur cluster assembly protein [Anaerolineaceae bacterium]|nr:iron-sulfur cluster assembly protein [Anaerolineaceae bacterium]
MENKKGINNLNWNSLVSHPELSERLMEGLKDVVDPELDLNVIQLGLIRDVEIKPDEVRIEMILTSPFCPYAPAMVEMTRKKAEEKLGKSVVVELGNEVWNFSMMEDGLADDWGMYY